MLVLARRKHQEIVIGDGIVVTVVEIRGDLVRLGITAPRAVTVDRREVHDRKMGEIEAPEFGGEA